MSKVITRFPPSPTGFLHIGSVRTALFNYLFAKHNGGVMFLRFEDTDKERSKKEFEADILEGLHWLGISYNLPDEPHQSRRTEIYKKHLVPLVERGLAYEAEPANDNSGKKVVRFKNPNKTVTFVDLVRGEVSFDTTELGDFVIARNMNEPLYHLAVVIDDHEMGVTHILRGEDHISNTQRQILISEALGFARPEYAHIPLILAPDKSKLSKRHGAVSVNEYRAEGYLPEALLNYVALLGWNPGGDPSRRGQAEAEREIFTLDELAQTFTVDRIHKGGAIFDTEKLKWFNHEHLKKLSDEEYARRLQDFMGKPCAMNLVPLLKERAQTLKEAADALGGGEYAFLEDTITYEATLLTQGAKTDAETVKKHLMKVSELLQPIDTPNFMKETVQEAVFAYATAEGRAHVLWPMRVALSGKEKSPDPFTLAALIGKEKTIRRIEEALRKL
ncbi:MAG: glutamate--tRNA ligase [Patescibacteria group bacterium]